MRSLVGHSLRLLRNRAPVAYAGRARASIPFLPTRDQGAQLRAMGSVGTLFAIVNRTSNALSQVEWRLWRKAASGKTEDRVRVTSHAVLDLWNKPNPFMHGQLFREASQQHLDLTGESWWVIARAGAGPSALRSLPLELWPVRPDCMTPVPSATDFLAGYIYTGPDGEQVPLALSDVIQLKMPNPEDPYRGMGPVQAILTELDSFRYSTEWNRNFFVNGASPGGVIEVDKRLSDDEFDEMSARWREQHQGVANAHRVAIIEQGKWSDVAYTNRDMQFVELRDVSVREIRGAFGIPKFAVGDVDDVNRATADASSTWFAEMLTVPRLERFRGALNQHLLPLYGATTAGLELDYVSPVRANSEADNASRDSRASSAKILIDAGFSPADTLTAFDLPEIPYGLPGSDANRDLLIKLVTSAPSLAPLILPMLGFKLPTVEAPDTSEPASPADAPSTQQARARRYLVHARVDVEATESVDLQPVQDTWQSALDQLLARWADEVSPAQYQALAEQVAAAVDAGDLDQLAAIRAPSDDAASLLLAAMVAMAAAAGRQVATEAAAQGVEHVTPVAPPPATMAATAGFVAAILAGRMALTAAIEARRITAPTSRGADVAAKVLTFLRVEVSDAGLRTELAGALTGAQNGARVETLRRAPVAKLYASEKLDKSSCKPCRDIHGAYLGDAPDMMMAVALYPTAGYFDCLGRSRCRGTVVAVWGTP